MRDELRTRRRPDRRLGHVDASWRRTIVPSAPRSRGRRSSRRSSPARSSSASATPSPTRAPTSPPRKTRAGARRRRVGDRRPEDVHDPRPRVRLRLPAHAHQPRRAEARGLTMFLVPIDTPGIEIGRCTRLGGERTNVTFYTDVRVPDAVPRRRGRRRLGRDDASPSPSSASPRPTRRDPPPRRAGRWRAARERRRARRPARPRATRATSRIDIEVGRLLGAARCVASPRRRPAGRRGLDGQALHAEAIQPSRLRALLDMLGAEGVLAPRRGRAHPPTAGSSTRTATPRSRRSTAAPARSSARSSPSGPGPAADRV